MLPIDISRHFARRLLHTKATFTLNHDTEHHIFRLITELYYTLLPATRHIITH